jgi:hypothetical protein
MTWWTHAEEGGSILVIPRLFQIMGRILESGWNLDPRIRRLPPRLMPSEPV